MGAWIETPSDVEYIGPSVSHPTWVRGLKLSEFDKSAERIFVAPYVGAWIETYKNAERISANVSRTLRGCVD